MVGLFNLRTLVFCISEEKVETSDDELLIREARIFANQETLGLVAPTAEVFARAS